MRRLTALLALALVVAACGGDDDDAATSTTTTAVSATSTTVAATTTTAPATTTSTTFPPDAALTENATVTTVGLGPVFIGMTVDEAAEAARMSMVGEVDPDTPGCFFIRPQYGLEGVSFMVLDGAIARVDINPPSTITTRSGAGIGMSEEALRELFPGQIEAAPTYVVEREGLQFVPRDENEAEFRVVFEMENGVVAAYRSGKLPGVGSAVGCSS